MDAEQQHLVQFVSDVRLILEGRDGSRKDGDGPIQTETLDRLRDALNDRETPQLEDPTRTGPRPPGPPRSGPTRPRSFRADDGG